MQDPAAEADRRVGLVRDRPAERYRLAREFYGRASGARRRYGAAELSFLQWCIARGVLDAEDAERAGSRWWRAVNDSLLRDKCEADLLTAGVGGLPSSHSVELWLRFIGAPRPELWYRAHNASIVAGYLRNEVLAADELEIERFMMNVALLRVFYIHVLLARPRLALGWLGPIGAMLADPRHRTVGWFLDLGRSFPTEYPVQSSPVQAIAEERPLARVLDYGVIAPRLPELYQFAADSLDEPRLPELLDEGTPAYAWPHEHRLTWHAGNVGRHLRPFAWITGAAAGYDRQFGRPAVT